MNAERMTAYNTMVDRINHMDSNYVNWSIAMGCCPFEPEHMIGVPIGMFHCQVCGDMVVAGMPHPHPNSGEWLE